jgi:hypothetical protein
MALGIDTPFGKMAMTAAAMAALLVTSGWVFYADDRLPSHSARIGTLSIDLPEGSGSGTAFLVDECGILTNFHVVFGPWYVTTLRPPSHEFTGTFTLTEVTLPDGSHPSARAIPVVWGDYEGPDRQMRRPEQDWAYLALDDCLGSQYGYFDLRDAGEPPVDRGFTAIGYSAGRQMADPGCAARAGQAESGKAWLHDCALLPGDSGGPIMRAGTLSIVAIASGYRAVLGDKACLSAKSAAGDVPLFAWGGGCANVAVPISDAIRQAILDGEAAVGMQRILTEFGYDAGPIGTIEAPQLATVIRQAERDMGWPVTGKPSCGLYKVLELRLATR